MLISAGTLLGSGCRETEVPEPSRPVPAAPAGQTPQPADPPVSQTPPAPTAPSVPGQLRKISWAPLDFKEFVYNEKGDLVRYSRQYNHVQGTDLVQRDEFTYAYDQSGKLTSVTNKDGFQTNYDYRGEVWSEALSLDKLGRPLKKYEFRFNEKKQLTGYSEFSVALNGVVTPRSKTSFTYDGKGNLVTYVQSWYVESSQSFVKSAELKFSDFDDRKYPKNADSFDYVLQPLSFFVNNPGKKEFLGNFSPVEHYSYTYDVHGYPSMKRTSYTYDKPIPSVEAVFGY